MKYKLSEIGDVIGGGTPRTKNKDYYTNDGISWITPKDLSGYEDMYISSGAKDITSSGLTNSGARLLPRGTVLVSSRAPIGYVAIASNPLTTNQGFKSIVPNKNIVIPEYLYFVMSNSVERLELIASGSTFKEISGKSMKNFEVEIPSLDEQRAILSRILPVINKININNRINDNLAV